MTETVTYKVVSLWVLLPSEIKNSPTSSDIKV